MAHKISDKPGGGIRIEISRKVLVQMLDSKMISIADIRCLDARSKQQVWQTCLEASLKD